MQLPPDLLLLVLGAVVAGFVQGLSGFAFAMVAMSIWVWGVEPSVASVMAVFGGLTGQIFSALTVRRSLRLPLLLPFLLGGLVGIPIGVAVLPYLNAHMFKLVFGLFLVIWCPAMLFAQRFPRIERGGKVADAFVGAAGGFMGGVGGFSGVMPSLWCTLRGYDKDAQRTIIQNFNLAALSVTMAVYIASGRVSYAMLPQFAVVAPALLIPVMIGTRLYVGLSDLAFRRLVLALLTLSGVAMLLSSLRALNA